MRHQDLERLPSERSDDDLTERIPGQALMVACLRAQAAAATPRSAFARTFGVRPLHPDARPWFVGVHGERVTARLLDALGPEYVVLHSVPVSERGTDIDHVVIGPMGVVTINSEHLRDARVWVAGDAVRVSGRPEQFVRAARSERDRVRETLGALALPGSPVTAVVAIVGAEGIDVREAPADVLVVDARRIGRTIRRMPSVLGHDAAWAVAAALASAATWGVPAERLSDEVRSAFTALEREVAVARAVRLAWAGALCAGLAAAAVGAASMLPALLEAAAP